MKNVLISHRALFGAVWVLCSALLFAVPGFESKSLIFGCITGYWPIVIAYWAGWDLADWILLLTLVGVSGMQLFLCSWAMDGAKVPLWFAKVMIGLVVGTIAIVVLYGLGRFDEWRGDSYYSLI